MSVQLIRADVIDGLNNLPNNFVDLIVTDPPYNIKFKYDTYKDNKSKKEYDDWVEWWLEECHRVLKEDGSIYVIAYNDILADHYKPLMDINFHFRRWLTWPYRHNYGHTDKNYVKAHRGILYYTKHPDIFTFNANDILIPYQKESLKNKKVLEAIEKHGRNGRYSYDWFGDINVVQSSHPEKQAIRNGEHILTMNQIPEQLLSIFIKASSNKNDVILDPFCGTGSTPAIALKLGRKAIAIDKSELYIDCASKRILDIT